jgi:uncharacterized protein (TIGR02246 family)
MTNTMTDEQAIRLLIDRWATASEAGDWPALEPLMHPDVTFLTTGNEPFGLDTFRSGFTQIVATMRFHVTTRILEIQVSAPLAYAWGHVEVTISPREGISGPTINRSGHVLSVYRKSPRGHWQMWRDANLMLREPVPI